MPALHPLTFMLVHNTRIKENYCRWSMASLSTYLWQLVTH